MTADLKRYRDKRNFERTAEPRGGELAATTDRPQFVVQKHRARRLHYDLRLEHEGVLKSWAVPKGPSLDPSERRLAVQTEDHPLEYATFEGVIPEREYGGGTVLVWDRGYWRPEGDPTRALQRGKLDFELYGEKLRGRWALVRMPTRSGQPDKDNWLLIKHRDRAARPAPPELLDMRPESALTGRRLEAVAAAQDRIWHSAGGEAAASGVPEVGRPESVPGARRAPLPGRASVQRPAASDRVPRGGGWFHEPKVCGRRILCRLTEGKAAIRDAGAASDAAIGEKLAPIMPVLIALPCRTALIDAEAVVFDANGLTDRAALDAALAEGTERIRLVALDLLYLDGWDLRGAALRARKELLRLLLAGAPPEIRYGDHVVGRGADFHREACRLGLEGVISKRADAPYRGGRSRTWLLTSCRDR